jgi:retron-type reverse transcriptase
VIARKRDKDTPKKRVQVLQRKLYLSAKADPRRGCAWAVDVDLKNYYDTIPHEDLMRKVQHRVRDPNPSSPTSTCTNWTRSIRIAAPG